MPTASIASRPSVSAVQRRPMPSSRRRWSSSTISASRRRAGLGQQVASGSPSHRALPDEVAADLVRHAGQRHVALEQRRLQQLGEVERHLPVDHAVDAQRPLLGAHLRHRRARCPPGRSSDRRRERRHARRRPAPPRRDSAARGRPGQAGVRRRASATSTVRSARPIPPAATATLAVPPRPRGTRDAEGALRSTPMQRARIRAYRRPARRAAPASTAARAATAPRPASAPTSDGSASSSADTGRVTASPRPPRPSTATAAVAGAADGVGAAPRHRGQHGQRRGGCRRSAPACRSRRTGGSRAP